MTRPLPRTEAISPKGHAAYLSKAMEFSESAQKAFDENRFHSAGLEAIHAAISACDALTIARLGLRCRGEDHREVLRLLERIPEPGLAVVHRQLAEILSIKSEVEYGSGRLNRSQTERVVVQAGRILNWVTEHLA